MFHTVGSPLSWGLFLLGFFIILALDLGVFNRKPHRVTMGEALRWSIVWVSLSLAFNGYVYAAFGQEKALEFMSAYFIEEALSVDNIFVFVVLFRYMKVPAEYLHRVLFAGILGALILRGIFIFAGLAIIERLHSSLYVFGAFLLITGIKMWWFADEKPDLAQNPAIRWIRRHMNVTDNLHGERFFVLRNQGSRMVRYATPLLLVLILVELSDLIFAVDSIPAIFAITTDPFIVLTSNVFAILGLRAMYFLLADMADRFTLLKYGLAIVLMFIGVKMLLIDLYPIPVLLSLGVVAAIIGTSIVLSLRQRDTRQKLADEAS